MWELFVRTIVSCMVDTIVSVSTIVPMTTEHPASFARDAQELAAEQAADLALTLRLAYADEATDPLERCSSLVCCAVSAHHAGSAMTDAVVREAQHAIAQLRLDLGCEDWRACSWDTETVLLAELHDALLFVVAARRGRSVRRAG